MTLSTVTANVSVYKQSKAAEKASSRMGQKVELSSIEQEISLLFNKNTFEVCNAEELETFKLLEDKEKKLLEWEETTWCL